MITIIKRDRAEVWVPEGNCIVISPEEFISDYGILEQFYAIDMGLCAD